MASETPPFDPSALTEPVDRSAVRAFTTELRKSGALRGRLGSIVLTVILAVVFVIVAVPVLGSLIAGVASGDTAVSPVSLLFFLFFLLVAGGAVYVVVRILRGTAERRYRLDRFARANGLSWRGDGDDPGHPGMIFDQGHSREVSDVLSGRRPRPVEIGNYRYKTGSGKEEQTHEWGYVALRLDTPLPHIVLDAVGNNGLFGMSNLPVSFSKRQRLSLEGDFDRHFALYCPQGYERDALYLFTPDVMARFVDNAAALDVEIVDDWLFLYARRDLSTLNPEMWRWLFSTIAAIEEKLGQWARWRDERLPVPTAAAAASEIGTAPPLTPPPAGVARGGRRLARGVPWVVVVAFVVIIGGWVISTFLP